MMLRRQWLAQTTGVLAATLAGLSGVQAQSLQKVAIAVPGPGNLLFLPLTLAAKIGADRTEGLEFDLRYVGGGPQAYRDMLDRNVDFSAGGLAALALQRINGKPVVSIAALTQVPAYTLLVRSSLRPRVRRVADLGGRVVGVKGHVPGGRSTTQLFTEHVLARAGLAPEAVNYVSVGQSYDSQRASLVSGVVDAVMGDEPFATRLVREKVAYVLADYHDPKTTSKEMGGLFLNGNLATREDVLASQPELTGRVVRAVCAALAWMRQHSPAELVKALAVEDAQERDALRDALQAHPAIYSPDGRFSAQQLATVTRFVHATELTPAAQSFDVKSMVNSRWSGAAP